MAFDVNTSRHPVGFQQFAAGSLAAAQALTVPAKARYAIIQAEAQNVRWRDDGVAPTAAVGMVLAAGDDMLYTGQLSKFRAIAAVAGAILNVTYYG